MLVLALDTTTRTGSVAVARDGRVLDVLAGDPARPHAERVPGDLVRSLERAGLRLADVDVFAVAAGPGSFTGLRIGIAAIQGLRVRHRPARRRGLCARGACAGRRRAAGATGRSRRIGVWMDAQRNEVFSALYAAHGAGADAALETVDGPAVGDPADTAARWHGLMGGAWCPVAGDGAAAVPPGARATPPARPSR